MREAVQTGSGPPLSQLWKNSVPIPHLEWHSFAGGTEGSQKGQVKDHKGKKAQQETEL